MGVESICIRIDWLDQVVREIIGREGIINLYRMSIH